jgi:hypothetical protein
VTPRTFWLLLLFWHTPFSIAQRRHDQAFFPVAHLSRLQGVLCSAVEEKTREGWGAGLLRFNQYCDSIGIPEEGRMPAPQILLCLFVANMGAGKASESCISGWLAGVHRAHQVHNAPWYGGDILTLAKKGAAKLVPPESKRDLRDPVTIEHIKALRKHLDLSNAFDASVFAIACIAFWACCRYVIVLGMHTC